MENDFNDIDLENICSSLMILEITQNNLSEFKDNPEALEQINKLKQLAKETMDSLTEEQTNQVLELIKQQTERIQNEIAKETAIEKVEDIKMDNNHKMN